MQIFLKDSIVLGRRSLLARGGLACVDSSKKLLALPNFLCDVHIRRRSISLPTAEETAVKIFYRVDASRVTFREYAYDHSLLVMPIVAMLKFFHVSTPFSSDDPAVEALTPFEVPEHELPEEVRERFGPLTAELEALGFGQPIFHQIYNALQHTYLYWATFAHASGRAAARIHHRVWSRPDAHRSYMFPVFLSELSDGSFLFSSAGKRDMAAPASIEAHYQPGASADDLWEAHQRRLDDRLPCQTVDVNTHERLRQMLARHHAALRDFHLARDVFKPVQEDRQAELIEKSDTTLATATGATVEERVLAKLEQMGSQKPTWTSFILILGISLMAFLAAGLKDLDRNFLWLLVPILLFHELGHYVTMRWFGYRNLRMFFIPFFGAAVAGKHYNIPGWKRAIVALAGPVPGILVGAAAGIVGMRLHQPRVTEIATLMIIINGFNLLPFMPLDGGWVLHAILFCRHPVLDLGFRLIAIVALFGVGWVVGGRLHWLGILLLLGLPTIWQVTRVAQRLRRRGASALSPDNVSIPPETVKMILAELGAGKHVRRSAAVLAQQVTSVFETLNARPPGVLASAGLLAVQGGSFLLALVFAIVFVMFRRGPLLADGLAHRDAPMPYRYTAGTAQQWADRKAGLPTPDAVTLLASYPDEKTAQEQFAALAAFDATVRYPKGSARSCLFGQTVVVTLPNDEETTREPWRRHLGQGAKDEAAVNKDSGLVFRFSATSPGATEAEALKEEFNAYVHTRNQALLLPPWSKAWLSLPPKERQRFEKARRTYQRLSHIRDEAAREPEVEAVRPRLTDRADLGDGEKMRKALEPYTKALQAAEDRLIRTISAEGEATVDPALVKSWQREMSLLGDAERIGEDRNEASRTAKQKTWQGQLDELHRDMALRMGALPLAGNQPKPGCDLETLLATALIRRKDRSVSITFIQFRYPVDGLPAFGQWLCNHGAGQIQYDLEAVPMAGKEADDDER
jgi:Zn-dependent protease